MEFSHYANHSKFRFGGMTSALRVCKDSKVDEVPNSTLSSQSSEKKTLPVLINRTCCRTKWANPLQVFCCQDYTTINCESVEKERKHILMESQQHVACITFPQQVATHHTGKWITHIYKYDQIRHVGTRWYMAEWSFSWAGSTASDSTSAVQVCPQGEEPWRSAASKRPNPWLARLRCLRCRVRAIEWMATSWDIRAL